MIGDFIFLNKRLIYFNFFNQCLMLICLSYIKIEKMGKMKKLKK